MKDQQEIRGVNSKFSLDCVYARTGPGQVSAQFSRGRMEKRRKKKGRKRGGLNEGE